MVFIMTSTPQNIMKNRADEVAHFLSADEVGVLLESDLKRGLIREDAERRLQQFGANTLTTKPGKSSWLRFLLQFHQPLIYILIAAGVVTAVLQEWVDSGVIFGVVLINGIIGFIQESKAEGALLALADTMIVEATVVRQGREKRIPSTGLVPGDLVLLRAGDKVPADVRLLRVRDLQVDESALTGESYQNRVGGYSAACRILWPL